MRRVVVAFRTNVPGNWASFAMLACPERKFAGSLAVDAVPSEPFSTVNSLLTGKIAGIFFDNPGQISSPHKHDKAQSAGFPGECTNSGNREYFESGSIRVHPVKRQASHPEIDLANIVVCQQFLCIAFGDAAAGFQEVAAACQAERHGSVLFYQQNRHAAFVDVP